MLYIRDIQGFETTMNGRFRRACSRCANLTGKRDKVKLAEEKRSMVERGGRPCLHSVSKWIKIGLGRDFLPDKVC